jgi:hypothetical protein
VQIQGCQWYCPLSYELCLAKQRSVKWCDEYISDWDIVFLLCVSVCYTSDSLDLFVNTLACPTLHLPRYVNP